MELPEPLVDRIVSSIQSPLPDGFTLEKSGPRTIRFRVSPLLATKARARSAFGMSQVGVRNRDGITPQSIAWATWMVLDSLAKMSRSVGLPWTKEQAVRLEAYAESTGHEVRAWVTNESGFRLDFPPIALDLSEMAPPSGGRLPFPLARRYQLPPNGPITSPGNRN
jgi:hypothetical protein